MIAILTTRTIAHRAFSVFGMLVLGACASCSSSSGAASPGSGDGGGSTSGGNVCAMINQADVQALLPAPISSATPTDPITCTYTEPDGTTLIINTFPGDSDQKYYKTISQSTDQQISGIGDEAYWNEVLDGQSAPELAAHKGTLTCVIQSDDPPDTTLKTTPNQSGLYTVVPADALAYVQLMGKVCNDIFAAQ